MNYKLTPKNKLVLLILLIFVLILSIITHIPNIKGAITLATTHKPEAFTELYFENSVNLPKIITDKKVYSFAFTVHNHENKNFDYSYIVYIQNSKSKAFLDQGHFILKNNESKTIDEDFGPLLNVKDEVIVQLVDKNQQIDFWMEPGGKS
jgi:hypothetical protein